MVPAASAADTGKTAKASRPAAIRFIMTVCLSKQN
jgi:hypothetical protein